jgi:[ribosomal protein S5]-alanine N-acetyltransferase
MYHIQSPRQQRLIEALSRHGEICLTTANSAFNLELLGQLSIEHSPQGDRVCVQTQEVKQKLSVNWREVHLARLDSTQKQMTLFNSARDVLHIRSLSQNFARHEDKMGLLQELPYPLPEHIHLSLPDSQWYMSPVLFQDHHAYVHYLNDPLIYRYTLNIPYPYTAKDANHWLSLLELKQTAKNAVFNLAIRNPKGELCGGIGIGIDAHQEHKGEIGYWLAQPYWGQGVMSRCVSAFCKWVFTTFKLQRITAQIMTINGASEVVLKRAGFQLEGLMTRHFVKDRQSFDGKLYALTSTP